VKLLAENRRDFNLEISLEFLDYVKAFNNVKRDKFLKYYKAKIFPF
jgi:hypothetical protein